MALSTVSANLAWQTAKLQLSQGAGAGATASPFAANAFAALKAAMAQTGGNPDLQVVPLPAASIVGTSGLIVADVACKLYAVYVRKPDTATDAYVAVLDDATDDTGIATDVRVVLPLLEAKHEAIFIDPKGVVMGTGVVVASYTDWDGTTNSSSADAPNGFAIIGAA